MIYSGLSAFPQYRHLSLWRILTRSILLHLVLVFCRRLMMMMMAKWEPNRYDAHAATATGIKLFVARFVGEGLQPI
jgi:hypothetical protein